MRNPRTECVVVLTLLTNCPTSTQFTLYIHCPDVITESTKHHHWNENVIIMTTFSAANEGNVIQMTTFPFQCCKHTFLLNDSNISCLYIWKHNINMFIYHNIFRPDILTFHNDRLDITSIEKFPIFLTQYLIYLIPAQMPTSPEWLFLPLSQSLHLVSAKHFHW